MNKVYIVKARGGYYEDSYSDIVEVFASKADAETYAENFLNTPELNEDYPDLHDVYVVEWDVH